MRQSCVLNALLKKSTSGCAKNLLKLNRDKPELVVISSKFRNRPTLEYVRVGDEFIAPNLSVRNLGVIMDNCFCMEQHVKKICSEANYHLRNISKIRKYLTQDSAQILIHAFISSKLDYCNSLLYRMGCRDGAVVRAPASHQCGPGSVPRLGVICGLSLLVLYSAPRGFLRVLRFLLSSKTNI